MKTTYNEFATISLEKAVEKNEKLLYVCDSEITITANAVTAERKHLKQQLFRCTEMSRVTGKLFPQENGKVCRRSLKWLDFVGGGKEND